MVALIVRLAKIWPIRCSGARSRTQAFQAQPPNVAIPQ
jgi:hypothetical protein